jgi:hypothetical protein
MANSASFFEGLSAQCELGQSMANDLQAGFSVQV